MKDKELLIEAIDAHDVYASSRRLTLKTLVELAVDGTVSVSPAALAKFIKIISKNYPQDKQFKFFKIYKKII